MEGASTIRGNLAGVAAVAGFLSGVTFGHMADRVPPLRLARLGAVGGGLLLMPQGLVHSFPALFLLRFAGAFCIGGFQPALQSWLAKTISHRDTGFFFGWGATVRALGWGLAPFAGYAVVWRWGIRPVFFAGGGLCLMLALVMPALAAGLPTPGDSGTTAPSVDDETGRIDGV